MPDYQVIEEHLRKLFYLTRHGYVKDGFCGKVIGFNVSASSVLRKPYTMQRVQDEIDINELPLTIEDHLGDRYTSFRLMIKP